jgi:hypothetical protein
MELLGDDKLCAIVDIDFDRTGQDINIAVRDHFGIDVGFGATDGENIGVATFQDAFLHDQAFPAAAGFERDLLANISLHVFPAGIEICLDDHEPTSSSVIPRSEALSPIAKILSLLRTKVKLNTQSIVV